MRLNKALLSGIAALALSTGAAVAGDAPLTHQSDPMGYQPYYSYEQGGPELLSEAQLRDALELEQTAQLQEYEVYDVYVIEPIVLIPLEEPSEVPISNNELG